MNVTPAMAQYYEMKEQYKDCILFFRMWDFYEMFDEDAHIAHKILWIAVTTRNKNAETPTPLAWIPYHAKEKYLPLLVWAWYKVAFAEQVSDPKLKWIVKREVVRVVTPATINLEGENYESSDNSNYIISIVEKDWLYWISLLDFSNNKWSTWEFNSFDSLKTELYKISPKEVILEKKLFWNTYIKEILEKKYSLNIYYFEAKEKAKKKLLNHFWVNSLEWYWIENKDLSQSASSMLLEYIESNQKTELKFLNTISYISFDSYMNLDESTIKNLDLIYNFSTKSSTIWTLFWVLNKTKTPMWASYLREQIIKPLNNIDEIKKRLDFIDEFTKNKILLDKIRKELDFVSNINSILNRLALNRANPRDLINLKKSLQSILNVYELIEKEGSNKLKQIIK
jgi:DNA mismatch repair protein MutS